MWVWIGLGALIGLAAAQRKGFNMAGGALGGALLGPLFAWLLFFVSGIGGEGPRRKCPHCSEWIQASAKVCKHCHRDVVPAGATA